ncbi:MAG: hypothetical protein JNL70_12190 [Saprospiraceae bacterium]|nr:hypothetical protein [Saprospiraceae bacterium]
MNKIVITTVGTSIFTNAMNTDKKWLIESDAKNLGTKIKRLESKSFTEIDWNIEKDKRESITELVKKSFAKSGFMASAEIKSLIKIAEKTKQDITAHLIATDTLLSVLACELIEYWFKLHYKGDYTISIVFNLNQDRIENLNIDTIRHFKAGLTTLMTRFYVLLNTNGNEQLILNITGGYKAIIPYLTILGQVNKVVVKYIFEDTEELIEIPRLPLSLDESLFDKYTTEFTKLENDTLDISEHYQFVQEAESCLDIDGKECMLNSLGFALWEKYKSQFFTFKCSDDVWLEIGKQKDIQRILASKFYDSTERASKNKPELQHKFMFKDGDNNNRIYYFEKNGVVFIYRTFENHSEHEKFLKTSFNESIKEQIINNSKTRKITINHV